MATYLWLALLGFVVGTFGTVIGAGGGFILVPILLLLYPHDRPEVLTSISLTVVFFNAASGSLAYARQRRIDYRSAVLFSMAAIPGAILGAMSTSALPRRMFDAILGAMMILGAIALIHRPRHDEPQAVSGGAGYGPATTPVGSQEASTPAGSANSSRTAAGMLISVVVGFVSSLLGIGGGIVHVPALIRILKFPVHVATATSHMILAIMALAGTLVHVVSGAFSRGTHRTVALSVGVILGAQLGAQLSNRFRGRWIVRGLAVGLAFVGARVLSQAFTPLGE
ncbi:MAG TPA: sulfite exporter TauE/SafE family protein [Phycisphaerae bacterium]|nr:sulfite exporter TauE/SafE family protein [Phycisphaerae bacterium]